MTSCSTVCHTVLHELCTTMLHWASYLVLVDCYPSSHLPACIQSTLCSSSFETPSRSVMHVFMYNVYGHCETESMTFWYVCFACVLCVHSVLVCVYSPGQLVDDDMLTKLYTHCRQIADGMAYLENRQFVHRVSAHVYGAFQGWRYWYAGYGHSHARFYSVQHLGNDQCAIRCVEVLLSYPRLVHSSLGPLPPNLFFLFSKDYSTGCIPVASSMCS